MKSFTDIKGEAWDVEINIGAAMRLKSRLDIEIDNLVKFDKSQKPQDVSLLEKISTDSILLFNVIFVICEKQIQDRKLTEEDFAARFNGDTIEAATDAVLDEIINFSRPAKRKVLLQLRQISKEYQAKAGEKLDQILADPKFSETINAEIEKTLPKLSTNAPESSEE